MSETAFLLNLAPGSSPVACVPAAWGPAEVEAWVQDWVAEAVVDGVPEACGCGAPDRAHWAVRISDREAHH